MHQPCRIRLTWWLNGRPVGNLITTTSLIRLMISHGVTRKVEIMGEKRLPPIIDTVECVKSGTHV